jgi:hypothetical protein
MYNLRELWERRQALISQLQTLGEQVGSREPNWDERAREEGFTKELVELDAKIKKGVEEAEREQRASDSFKRYQGLMVAVLRSSASVTSRLLSGSRVPSPRRAASPSSFCQRNSATSASRSLASSTALFGSSGTRSSRRRLRRCLSRSTTALSRFSLSRLP